ncbi:MAG TPA: ATP-dependent zinc metalloprotease FtsH [Pirellulaceae bacterium]|nr:ATP-dependent zinc metalloprotease FtsH [Pirellulaceae bacterium]
MEKSPQDDLNKDDGRPAKRRPGPNLWLLLAVMGVLAAMFILRTSGVQRSKITWDFFLDQIEAGNVEQVKIYPEKAHGLFKLQPKTAPAEYDSKGVRKDGDPDELKLNFWVVLPADDFSREEMSRALTEKGVQRVNEPSSAPTLFTIYLLVGVGIPLLLFLFIWTSFRRSRDQFMGGGFLSGFSKSPAKKYEPTTEATTFDDVAGLEQVKADLTEMVEYLKDPKKFQKLGGRVPKGVLLMGAPGTGKTLLARAVAGEADVPFVSVSGSEFIQMFVGVGASRVRDLFQNAKEQSPSIIFIDEIDAVGRQRGAGLGGGHDEREQTLNQILSEMDGFLQTDSVIVLAATNRPDVLDPALMRPGRFDRHVTVGRPTQKGRKEIFKVHVRDVPLSENVDLDVLASSTIGLTGADIRNIVNEAALWAARQDKSIVEMNDFDYARDKVLMGAKREETLSEEEKEKTAYHEAGHTLSAWSLKGAHRVHKVSIIPRGRTLGATHTMPSEDRLSMSQKELEDHLVMLLGGRAAEELVYNETTIGAENDLERATSMARRMVTHWGMSEQLGPVSYKMSDEDPFLGREIHQQRQFSEHTMELIDAEVAKILHAASERSVRLLTERRDELEKIAGGLIENEELDESEITALIGPSVHADPSSNGRSDAARSSEPTADV